MIAAYKIESSRYDRQGLFPMVSKTRWYPFKGMRGGLKGISDKFAISLNPLPVCIE